MVNSIPMNGSFLNASIDSRSRQNDPEFSNIVMETLDILTFNKTHDVDDNFSLQPCENKKIVEQQLREEKNNLNLIHGPIAELPPHNVKNQLLTLFRAEADSVKASRHSGNFEESIVDKLSYDKIKILKKDIKKKIHEWDSSFKAYNNGEEPLESDKSDILPIYSVYKLTKNKLLSLESNKTNVDDVLKDELSETKNNTSYTQAAPTNVSYKQLTASDKTETAVPVVRVPSNKGLQTKAFYNFETQNKSENSATETSTITKKELNLEVLRTEKRRLKRILYEFEVEFERCHGRAPTKKDRLEHYADYNRYAKLKDILASNPSD